jgi:hypothetical protein
VISESIIRYLRESEKPMEKPMSDAERKIWDEHSAMVTRRRNRIPPSADTLEKRRRVAALDELVDSVARLRAALARYEETGDHDHGRGPIAPDGPCGNGSDCWVARARKALAAIGEP